MTESQLTIAVAFVTELISLGVLYLVPHGVPPFLSRQTITTRPVDINFRHEEGTPTPIMCIRPSTHYLP
jgi:hypothetical protein